MIKLTATYGDWKVNRHENHKTEVYKSGELCPKSAPALRDIAKEIGLEINPEWRTSQLSRNVIKAMLKASGNNDVVLEDENSSEEMKTIRLSFNVDGQSYYRRVRMLPVSNEFGENMVADAEDMGCSPTANGDFIPYLLGREEIDEMFFGAESEPLEFMFISAYSPVELIVTDDDTEDCLFDEEVEIGPNYGLLNPSEAKQNWPGEDEKKDYQNYMHYLEKTRLTETNDMVGICLKEAWEEVKADKIEGVDILPEMMRIAMHKIEAQEALLLGELELDSSTITFTIQIPADEEFDPDKLDYINIDRGGWDNSGLMNNMLGDDICFMNAIMYDGKMYFADQEDINLGDNVSDEYFDIVDAGLESLAKDYYEFN